LLQSIYGAFDKVARKRRVFKVETIGDSYMAVTGIPDPQSDHAVIMARFAQECLAKMNDATCQLVDRLGEGTEELSLRIGMVRNHEFCLWRFLPFFNLPC
jgi:class 3 adenylate cyclase